MPTSAGELTEREGEPRLALSCITDVFRYLHATDLFRCTSTRKDLIVPVAARADALASPPSANQPLTSTPPSLRPLAAAADGMDFLKSCSTNVRVVENLVSIPCEAFILDTITAEDKRNSQLYRTVATLRSANILCTLDGRQLNVFGYKLDGTRASLKELGYREAEFMNERRKNALLDAVEGSLAYKLAADGLIHVAPWTWLFFGDDLEIAVGHGGILIELCASLSSNGTLLVSSATRSSPWLPVGAHEDIDSGTSCMLAPSGSLAKIRFGKQDENQPVVGSPTWRDGVVEVLQAEGVQSSGHEQWDEFETDQDGTTIRFMWPSRLCFQPSERSANDFPIEQENWRKWFDIAIAKQSKFRDPLALAEEWFIGSAGRGQADAGNQLTQTDSDGVLAPPEAIADLATSPPFNQRAADQQAALSGIYPTPPDGLLPGTQGAQQVPTSESNPMPPINETSELLPGEEMEVLRQSISSSNAPEAGFQRSDDDLFGDMGEMDFGGNEVGDEDFDYFDEPDDEPINADDALEKSADVKMADAAPFDEPGTGQQTAHEVMANQETQAAPEPNTSDIELPTEGRYEHLSRDSTTDAGTNAAKGESVTDDEPPKPPDRPLSPFGIRERLLPPPIPASAIRAENEKGRSLRRSSTFGPVTFNDGLELSSKYINGGLTNALQTSRTRKLEADISLPPKPKKQRGRPASPDVDSPGPGEESDSSEEDSSESATSISDAELPHKMPWESRKRKRATTGTDGNASSEHDLEWMSAVTNAPSANSEVSAHKVHALETMLLPGIGLASAGPERIPWKERFATLGLDKDADSEDYNLMSIDQLFEDLEDLDLVYIAQLSSEQSASVITRLIKDIQLETPSLPSGTLTSAIQPLFEQALNGVLPTALACDLPRLALPRESARQMPPISGKGPHAVPRPPQRSDSVQQGPDYCPILAPYIRIQRYGDTVEMLPPALHFWNTLGLSPANGAKDLRVVSVVPGHADLVRTVQSFLGELRLVYEANKLGSWKTITGLTAGGSDELTIDDESTVVVHPPSFDEPIDSADILQAYALVCESLGKALALIGHEEPDRTVLVCIVNPFTASRAHQALCACFWMLYKSYRDNTPKAQRASPRSDIVLRLLPVDLIARPDGLVILDQHQYGQLAMEVYDRCPPSAKSSSSKDVPAALLPYFAAPAVELAMPVPRRIPFQLTADPPGDLLHENSILHLAYALSADRQWLCFAWIDASGRYASQMSACLRGRSIADAVGEAWERTGDWMRARDVTWRVYIVGVSAPETSVEQCWRAIVTKKPRRQPLHVTLLSVDLEPELELKPPSPPIQTAAAGEKSGQGFLTPVTTPSGTSMTVSPDASTAAPPTPAPSDPVSDGDGEAHLVDLADESWGLMLAPTINPPSKSTSDDAAQHHSQPLTSGMLFRRGSDSTSPSASEATSSLESLAVSLHWDIRLRPNGTVDEGPPRQAEFTLREVLRLFRNLAVLGKARGLGSQAGMIGEGRAGKQHGKAREQYVTPVHVSSVLSGVRGVDGMLG